MSDQKEAIIQALDSRLRHLSRLVAAMVYERKGQLTVSDQSFQKMNPNGEGLTLSFDERSMQHIISLGGATETKPSGL